jgi:prevent-host-death family protein
VGIVARSTVNNRSTAAWVSKSAEASSLFDNARTGSIVKTMKATKSIAATEFKAKCLDLLDRVEATREPLIITKRGRPVAEVVPIKRDAPKSLLGSVTFHGDIVGPIVDEWEP